MEKPLIDPPAVTVPPHSASLARAAAALQHQLAASPTASSQPNWIRATKSVMDAHAAGATLVVLIGGKGAGNTRLLHELAAALRYAGTATRFLHAAQTRIDPEFEGAILIDDADRIELSLLAIVASLRATCVILAGSPLLLKRMAGVAAPTVVTLPPLRPAEVRRSIARSIPDAGVRRNLLGRRVIDCLHGWSGGSGRQSSALAAASLAAAALAGERRLTVQRIDQAAIELGLERGLSGGTEVVAGSRVLSAAIVAAAIAVSGAIGIEAFHRGSISRSSAYGPERLPDIGTRSVAQGGAKPEPPAAVPAHPPRTAPNQVIPHQVVQDVPTQSADWRSGQPSMDEQPPASTAVLAQSPRSAEAEPIAPGLPLAAPAARASASPEPADVPRAVADGSGTAQEGNFPSRAAPAPATDPTAPAVPANAATPGSTSDAVASRETAAAGETGAAQPPAAERPMQTAALSRELSETFEPPATAGGMARLVVRPEARSETTRITIHFTSGDAASADAARALSQALRTGGYAVEPPVALHGRAAAAEIRYYFLEDAPAAAGVAKQVAALFASAAAQRAPARQPWPPPGSIDVIVPATTGIPR